MIGGGALAAGCLLAPQPPPRTRIAATHIAARTAALPAIEEIAGEMMRDPERPEMDREGEEDRISNLLIKPIGILDGRPLEEIEPLNEEKPGQECEDEQKEIAAELQNAP